MPYLSIKTNQPLPVEARASLLARASQSIAKHLGKSEQYVMIAVEDAAPLLFGGNDQPAAYLELKSIGLPEGQTPALSHALCELLEAEIGVPRDRIYVEFADASRSMWGWNGTTF